MNLVSQSNISRKVSSGTSRSPIALTKSEVVSLRQDFKAAMEEARVLVAQGKSALSK
jgi:hypothetical protein